MSNISFSGPYKEWLEYQIPAVAQPSHQGFIYAFFFKNGMAKVGSSQKPHARIEHLLKTVSSAALDAVEHVILSIPIVYSVQQELALHKKLPQDQRTLEYFKINAGSFTEILEQTELKETLTAQELYEYKLKGDQARHAIDDLFIKPLQQAQSARDDYMSQINEFSYQPRHGAAIKLLAHAAMSVNFNSAAACINKASEFIDTMPDSPSTEEVAVLMCAVSFAIQNGFHDHAKKLLES